jgi:hypothetical protein
MLDEVKEMSEPGSRSSMDLSLKPEEESLIHMKFEGVLNENERLKAENEDLTQKVQALSSQVKELERQKTLQRKEAIQEAHAKIKKEINEEYKSPIKESIGNRLSIVNSNTFEIEPVIRRLGTYEALEKNYRELKSMHYKKCEEVNQLNLEIIRIKEENLEILKENQGFVENQQSLKLDSGKKNVTWSEKESRNYSFLNYGLSDEMKEELELAKERNLQFEKKIEEIKFCQSKLSQFHESSRFEVTEFYKRIYELYLRKETYLEDKENRILHLCKLLEDDVQSEYQSNESLTWLLVLLFILVLCLIFYKYLLSHPIRF